MRDPLKEVTQQEPYCSADQWPEQRAAAVGSQRRWTCPNRASASARAWLTTLDYVLHVHRIPLTDGKEASSREENVAMKVNGKCHCGAITYEAIVDPQRVAICHCADCQRLTGSAYRVSVPAAPDSFSLLTGSPAVYVKRAESGAKRAQAFCSVCGSPLYTYAPDADVVTYGLRVGCIDQRRELPPRQQKWCQSALEWSMDITHLPRRDRE